VRYLIVTDIHANWEALEAVLARAEGAYDKVLCCGDVVGYGADPNRAVEWVRANAQITVRGNHDKACAGGEDLEWFNPLAQASALWTQSVLTPENLTWLRNLPRGPSLTGGFQILHGSPLDEDDYVITQTDAAQLVGYLETAISFFGHTHLQGGFAFYRRAVRRLAQVPAGEDRAELSLDRDQQWMVNPGSVGQPRDGDPRAAFAVFDDEQRLVTYHRVEYNLDEAMAKIRQAGLPELLALRLAAGH
jgi:diadenosine tetraphosphatase ApaH/serine/threonine PP2A family protein phosphatase